jgi:hypothetical protein
MSDQAKHLYGLELTNEQCLEVSDLITDLKEAGLLMDKENMGMFMTTCFYRGLMEYKKDLKCDD